MNIPLGQVSGEPAAVRGAPGARSHDRLDGWKQIAAHFGRDRSTVIRWTRERGLPVHRLPGGRTGTVYALRHELDRWAGLPGPASSLPFADEASRGHSHNDGLSLPRRSVLVGALAPLAVSVGVRAESAPIALAPSLPTDPDVANRFLAARDLVAEREAEGLERAIGLLEEVTRDVPPFAPAQAALAEALILSREFGMRRDGDAFRRARHAARTAIRLDPALAAGHRSLGFIAFWADGDFAEAQAQFRLALELDPDDALSHFWYGNVLSNHGDHAAALAALNRARLMLPGSVAIRTDLAWAQWAMGDDATAMAALTEIVRRYPDFAVVHESLALVAFMRGDDAGYVHHSGAFARSRGEAGLMARAEQLTRALRTGAATVRETALRHARADLAEGHRNHVWAVAITSLQQDRETTLALLSDAVHRHERWNDAGLVARIRQAWREDHAIVRQIDALHRTV